MANEIKLANVATPTDVISNAISKAFVEKIVCLPHVFGEDLPVGTNLKKARRDAALGLGSTVAEADNYSFSTPSVFTQDSVSLTAAKSVIASKITVEAMEFAGVNDQQIIDKQANSLARTLDNAVKALASGFSQTVSSASVLTIEDGMEAAYLIRAGNAAPDGKRMVWIVDFKGRHQLDKQKIQSGAAAFSNEGMLSLLYGLPQPNGYVGTVPGLDVYEVGGLPTGGGKRSSMVLNPELAIFGIYGTIKVLRKQPDSQGLYTELTSYVFNQVAEWNDAAGVEVESNQ